MNAKAINTSSIVDYDDVKFSINTTFNDAAKWRSFFNDLLQKNEETLDAVFETIGPLVAPPAVASVLRYVSGKRWVAW